jgi:hypothetical protein
MKSSLKYAQSHDESIDVLLSLQRTGIESYCRSKFTMGFTKKKIDVSGAVPAVTSCSRTSHSIFS